MSDELTDAEYLELNRLQVLIGQERLAAVVVPVLERLAQAPSGTRPSVGRALLDALRVEAKKHVY